MKLHCLTEIFNKQAIVELSYTKIVAYLIIKKMLTTILHRSAARKETKAGCRKTDSDCCLKTTEK